MAKVGQALHRLIGKRRAIKATLKGQDSEMQWQENQASNKQNVFSRRNERNWEIQEHDLEREYSALTKGNLPAFLDSVGVLTLEKE